MSQWRVSSPEYTNKNNKRSGYQQLVDYSKTFFPNADQEFVKQKIQNMRTSFRKEVKKVQDSRRSGSGADERHSLKVTL